MVASGLAQEQFQEGDQIGFKLLLIFQGIGQFFFFQQLDEAIKLQIDQLFIAHLDSTSQEGRPAWILRGGQLRHPQKHLFEPTIPFS